MIANLNIEYNILDNWSILSFKISYNHKSMKWPLLNMEHIFVGNITFIYYLGLP